MTDAVHAAGGRIALQILHAGRYAKIDGAVGPSTIASPINPNAPRRMSEADILRTIADYAATAALAREAGYDGVEIMGERGLSHQRVHRAAHQRPHRCLGRQPREPAAAGQRRSWPRCARGWGATSSSSSACPRSIWCRAASPPRRSRPRRRAVEAAGADIINQGIGWHEARVPTIAQKVPRAAWAFAARRLKEAVQHPRHRLQPHQHARGGGGDPGARRRRSRVDGAADAGRPRVRQQGARGPRRRDQRVHRLQPGVPRPHLLQAGGDLPGQSRRPAARSSSTCPRPPGAKRIAVVGAGPAGLACAVTAAERGHAVTLYEAQARIGGQLNLARNVPGKEEFDETLRYYRPPHRAARRRSATRGAARAPTRWRRRASMRSWWRPASSPRVPAIPGIDHAKLRELRRHPQRHAHGGPHASPSWAPAASASTSPSSSPRRRRRWRRRRSTSRPSGASMPRSPAGAGSRNGGHGRGARSARW